MGVKGRTWFRKPNLADLHPKRKVHYFQYRDQQGKVKKFWCTNNRQESQLILDQWDIDRRRGVHYASILSREEALCKPTGSVPASQTDVRPSPVALVYSFVDLVLRYRKFLQTRRRPRGMDGHLGGFVCGRQLDEMLRHLDHLSEWFYEKYGKQRCLVEPLHRLMVSANECYEMMLCFMAKYKGSSQYDKHRQRFLDLARFSRNERGFGALSFSIDDLPKIKKNRPKKKRGFPTIQILQKLLHLMDLQQKTWFWMALGMGFHQNDLARATPGHFKRGSHYQMEYFDMPRHKTNEQFEREGPIPPLVKAYIAEFLNHHSRADEDLLFITRFGNPYAYDIDKTDDEIANGTMTHGPSKTSTRRADNFGQEWRALKEAAGVTDKLWPGGDFYGLRHLGATIYGSRDGVSLLDVRKFLGQSERSLVADTYLHNVPLEAGPVVEWLTSLLDGSDREAWSKPVKKRRSRK